MDNIYRLMKLNRMVKSHRLKFTYLYLAHKFNLRHLFVKFDPVMACNLSCGMCYFSDDEWRRKNKGVFKKEEIDRIAQMFFPKAMQVMIGCSAEPTLYKQFPDLVKLAKDYKVPYVGLVSNGQNITEENIQKMIVYGLDELVLSLHGVKKETYETLMVKASYDRFHELLQTLDAVKTKNKVTTPALRINYTVNPDNLNELSEFFDVFGQYNIRTLQVRPIIDLGTTTYKKKDMSGYLGKYQEVISKLASISKLRKMIFMANVIDPTYQTDVQSSVIVDAVQRFVSPQIVWKRDFDWRNESYEEYLRRTKWSEHIGKCITKKLDELPKMNSRTTYEVNF